MRCVRLSARVMIPCWYLLQHACKAWQSDSNFFSEVSVNPDRISCVRFQATICWLQQQSWLACEWSCVCCLATFLYQTVYACDQIVCVFTFTLLPCCMPACICVWTARPTAWLVATNKQKYMQVLHIFPKWVQFWCKACTVYCCTIDDYIACNNCYGCAARIRKLLFVLSNDKLDGKSELCTCYRTSKSKTIEAHTFQAVMQFAYWLLCCCIKSSPCPSSFDPVNYLFVQEYRLALPT